MLIGQLVVNLKMQEKGLGKILPMHALARAVRIGLEIKIYAVRVDAIDEKAEF